MLKKAWLFFINHADGFTLALIATLILAVLLPAGGDLYKGFKLASYLVVASLFFMHGLKLSPRNLWAGLTSWRLHLVITLATFALFPVFGLVLKPVVLFFAGDHLYLGMLFLCVLPSTVQSSIAFTSIAGGNVAAAVCSASFSSLLGVFVTPLLVNLLFHAGAGVSLGGAVWNLCLQLVFPFAAGQLARPWLLGWISRRGKLLSRTDRLSVLFIVYVSFSHGTTSGLWQTLSWPLLAALVLCCGILLAMALAATSIGARLLGFARAERIVVIFCGSKKSLITGVPMANVIFPPDLASVIILPLMVFHQMQLLACSHISRRMSVSAPAGA
ncbi:MAG: bile acid:sodium symporter [Deltaproteobacteria bacterium]|jgi:sodium/bile acid cotransporter 7|nr:bile acid:sodium symporter [Deltaproteobacteria bacterium]